MIEIDYQRLRNLTTGILHTKIEYVYKDLEMLFGQGSLWTHQLPDVQRAVAPWLKKYVPEVEFWDGTYDTAHIGTHHLPVPTTDETNDMLKRYMESPRVRVNKIK